MMEKDPAKRFQSAEDVVRALTPHAAERIAGRPVVTTSVRTAAETREDPGTEMTISQTMPFIDFFHGPIIPRLSIECLSALETAHSTSYRTTIVARVLPKHWTHEVICPPVLVCHQNSPAV